MSYRFGVTLDHWYKVAHDAAPLGPLAVEDVLRCCATCAGIEIVTFSAAYDPPDTFNIAVAFTHCNRGDVDATLRQTFFTVCNPNVHMPWADCLKWMKDRQASMPAHLRGRAINVDEETYNDMLQRVRRDTGYTGLTRGDLWVHVSASAILFGELTKAGELAMWKYKNFHKMVARGYTDGTDGITYHNR